MLCISDQGVGLNLFQSLMIGMVSSRLGWGFPFCMLCETPAQGQDTGAQRIMKPAALTVRECCASLNFWLLFFVFGVGTGIGLMFVNNLGTCSHAALSADAKKSSIAYRIAKISVKDCLDFRSSRLCQQVQYCVV